MEKSFAESRFGIHEGDGLQTRCWAHHRCAFFLCAVSGGQYEMAYPSITLFDGQARLGDLCKPCVAAGPVAAAGHAHRQAEDLREQTEALDDLAKDLRTLDPARWSTLAELHAEQQIMMADWQLQHRRY